MKRYAHLPLCLHCLSAPNGHSVYPINLPLKQAQLLLTMLSELVAPVFSPIHHVHDALVVVHMHMP